MISDDGYRLIFPGAGTWKNPESTDPYGAINAARKELGLSPLKRDFRLEELVWI